MACVAEANRRRCLDVDVADEQLHAELGCAGDQLARVIGDERVTVEDEFVLSADERAERDRGDGVLGALGDHPLSLQPLAGVVGRRRDVHDQPRSRERLVAGGRARHPDVLADRQPDRNAVDLDQRPAFAVLKVAVLVEDAVVGQAVLAVDAADSAVSQHRRAVVDVVAALREADHRDDPVGIGGDPVERVARVREEVLLQQQVLGRVARDRKLREQRKLGACAARLRQLLADLPLVAVEVADDGVDLREGEPHGPLSMAASRPPQLAARVSVGPTEPRRTVR